MGTSLLDWLQGRPKPSAPEVPAPSPLLAALFDEALPAEGETRYVFKGPELKEHAPGRAILGLDPAAQADLVIGMFAWYQALAGDYKRNHRQQNVLWAIPRVLAQLLRRKLPFAERHLLALIESTCRTVQDDRWSLPIPKLVALLEDYARSQALGEPLRAALDSLVSALEAPIYQPAAERRLLDRLRLLPSLAESAFGELDLSGGDAWRIALRSALEEAKDTRAAWVALLTHAATASAAQPSVRWLDQARKLLRALPADEVPRMTALCLGELGRMGTHRTRNPWTGAEGDLTLLLDEEKTDLLRGLVWCAGLVDDPGLVGVLGDAAEFCFRKVSGHGPFNVKIGNACLDTLSRLDRPEAVAQISRLRARVQHASTGRQIEKVLNRAAERQGISAAELEEMSVPAVDPEDIKEIKKLLPGQRMRLERFYLHPREWDFATWKERYLDHPLVGLLARRLIWRFDAGGESRTGIWRDGGIVNAEGRALNGLDAARITLWHPLGSSPEQVLAWRRALEDWGIVQPFKQAHREIYVLTDAERRTATYSNRFAAHILRQHQFQALCHQRGWTYSLIGEFDSHNTPTLLLPELGLRLELWVDALFHEGGSTGMGIFLNITTDQVRFCDPAGQPRPLDQIPPLQFSELMRDVDLFVGVCSVGNDPTWADQAERPGFRYWSDYSRGELGESARTRRDLLERLIPRLKIAGRCSLTDRFLVVRGDLRTYKIHLGSTNIFMEPNDQYLCIVQDRPKKKQDSPLLPFEGDSLMAVILSKAFLLAADRKITDPTITRQIGQEPF